MSSSLFIFNLCTESGIVLSLPIFLWRPVGLVIDGGKAYTTGHNSQQKSPYSLILQLYSSKDTCVWCLLMPFRFPAHWQPFTTPVGEKHWRWGEVKPAGKPHLPLLPYRLPLFINNPSGLRWQRRGWSSWWPSVELERRGFLCHECFPHCLSSWGPRHSLSFSPFIT